MESDSDYHKKMDALDLLMTALKDHEKRLDKITHELKRFLDELKTGETGEVAKEKRCLKAPVVICKRWREFKDKSRGAEMVAYEVEGNRFHVYSMVDGRVFAYVEDLPGRVLRVVEEEDGFSIDRASVKDVDALRFLMDGRLRCGLGLSVKSSRTQLTEKEYLFELSYELGSDEVKMFLSRELSVSKRKVVEGKIGVGN